MSFTALQTSTEIISKAKERLSLSQGRTHAVSCGTQSRRAPEHAKGLAAAVQALAEAWTQQMPRCSLAGLAVAAAVLLLPAQADKLIGTEHGIKRQRTCFSCTCSSDQSLQRVQQCSSAAPAMQLCASKPGHKGGTNQCEMTCYQWGAFKWEKSTALPELWTALAVVQQVLDAARVVLAASRPAWLHLIACLHDTRLQLRCP